MTRPGRLPLWLAPLSAALFTAVLYWFRVDSVFYFLHGSEAQGVLLARALADGQGFVDLSLPGHPAHVREPPLFYLLLALVIKLRGFDFEALKVVTWASYAGIAAAAVLLLQRRANPWLALAAVVMAMASPEMFHMFTGPKSDFTFTVISFLALLAIETLAEALLPAPSTSDPPRLRKHLLAAAVALLVGAAVLTRSLGMALIFAVAGGLFLTVKGGWREGWPARRRAAVWAALVIAPVILASGLWSARSGEKSEGTNYTYLDWFLMDLKPDSPEMMAVDFHAPLLERIPRGSLAVVPKRVLHHAWFYPAYGMSALLGLPRQASTGRTAALIVIFILAAVGLYRSEAARPPAVLSYLLAYTGVILVWPMDDPRLLLPLFPCFAFYLLRGLESLIASAARSLGSSRAEAAGIIIAIVAAALISGLHLTDDQAFARAVNRLPTVTDSPGLQVRFFSLETMESYQALVWSRDHLPARAVLMYHSTPPCRLISGHACSPIPFNPDLARVHAYVLTGPADYLVADSFGVGFPTGPGLFVERVMKPLIAAYPGDFTEVFRSKEQTAAIYRVNRPGAPPP